jgi:hypothetical protein
MSWPEPLSTLLAIKPSPASQALRWGLHGLRATLRAALDEAPASPGVEALHRLLAEIDTLLEGSPPAADPVLPADGATDQPPLEEKDFPTASRWLPVARAMAADPTLRAYLVAAPLRGGSDDDLWSEVHRLLLHVPVEVARKWHSEWEARARELGARTNRSQCAQVPLPRDEELYSGLDGGVQATGLRTSATAPLDSRVKAPSDGGLRFLAGVVSTWLWFIEHDPRLCHCLKSVFRFGITPLDDAQRERYQTELLRLWERVAAGPGEPQGAAARQLCRDRLKAHLDLDEAIHSLLYPLPIAPDSWWGQVQGQAREALFAARDRAVAAGCPAHLQVLGGSFAEINRLAPDSLQVDFGVPGEVAACLRVWARIDGEEIKGRVLYRSPREEP